MALTDYDKQNLTKEQQAKVQAATDKWTAAQAKGDTEGMKSAAAEAAEAAAQDTLPPNDKQKTTRKNRINNEHLDGNFRDSEYC